MTSDASLAQARQAENEIQHGKWRGPLWIPSLKDLFDTADICDHCGKRAVQGPGSNRRRGGRAQIESRRRVLLGPTWSSSYGGNARQFVLWRGNMESITQSGRPVGGLRRQSLPGLLRRLVPDGGLDPPAGVVVWNCRPETHVRIGQTRGVIPFLVVITSVR